MSHDQPHPFAGKMVIMAAGDFKNHPARVHDWRDRIRGASWRIATDPSAERYRVRRARVGLPDDDEVVAATLGIRNELVHASELPK